MMKIVTLSLYTTNPKVGLGDIFTIPDEGGSPMIKVTSGGRAKV